MKYQAEKRQNISTDHLLTSIEVAKWLLEQNITTVDAIHEGRLGTRQEVFDTKDHKGFSKICHFKKEKKRYVSYIIYSVLKILFVR